MKQGLTLKKIVVYYAKAAVFAIVSYGLIILLYGRTGISFLEWMLILLVAFTVGYIPSLIRMFRDGRSQNP